MEGMTGGVGEKGSAAVAVAVAEKLNAGVQNQLNLDSIKTRAISLYKAISRILEDLDAISRANASPKWQDVLGQFSMVNLELFNIVEDIKKTSKAFVVLPKNVNAENATILPVMLSSKLLPEMETIDGSKREQLLLGMQNLPIPLQTDKLKARIDMIAGACESAERVLAETRKAYGLDIRQRMITLPTMDKTFAAKIQEQENLLRAAVNHGDGLRLSADQKQLTNALPMHLVDVLGAEGGQTQTFTDSSGMYIKNTPPMSSGNISNQGTPLQFNGRSAPSPSGGSQAAMPFDNQSPLTYGNSPRSGTNMMNAPSPQQQTQQQQQQLQQQHRQKLMQQFASQNQLPQMNDLQAQAQQQKFQALQGSQMQFSQPLTTQQFQGRQLPTGHIQHGVGQSQLNQGTQMNRHMGQFAAPANSALFNAAQSVSNASMMTNMSATMSSQPFVPRLQFGLPGNAQRTHTSQILNDQMFNAGVANSGNVMPMQQQQQQQQQYASQGAFGSMQQNTQSLQPNMVSLQNTQHTHPNFQQQRQQQNPQ